jgi:hypothetical protein
MELDHDQDLQNSQWSYHSVTNGSKHASLQGTQSKQGTQTRNDLHEHTMTHVENRQLPTAPVVSKMPAPSNAALACNGSMLRSN